MFVVAVRGDFKIRNITSGSALVELRRLVTLSERRCPMKGTVVSARGVAFCGFKLGLNVTHFTAGKLIMGRRKVVECYNCVVPRIRSERIVGSVYVLFKMGYGFWL